METTDTTILDNITPIPTQIPPQTDYPTAQIGIKLNGTNYAIWSQIMEMYISGKDKLGYINGDLPQPTPTDDGEPKTPLLKVG